MEGSDGDRTTERGGARDDLGAPIVDESTGKRVSPGGGGGGSDIDPSYEMALHILGRPEAMPSPITQAPITMQDDEGAELARRLTRLREVGGVPDTAVVEPMHGPAGDAGAVEALLRALIDPLPDPDRIRAAAEQARGMGPEVAAAVDEVLDHPGVRARSQTG